MTEVQIISIRLVGSWYFSPCSYPIRFIHWFLYVFVEQKYIKYKYSAKGSDVKNDIELTPATPRGIRVTLNPKGGPQSPPPKEPYL